MINTNIDLNLFQTLDAIYTHGNVTKAADALNLTQSAVSHALNRLREAFDDPLFIRQGRRMVPTARTETVIEGVRSNVAGLKSTLREPEAFDPAGAAYHFRLGFRDVLETMAFPSLLEKWTNIAPGLRFSSQRINPPELSRDLAAGRLDVAVDMATVVDDTIDHQGVWEEPLAVVTRSGVKEVSIDRYLTAGHVLVTLEREAPEVIDRHLARVGQRRDVRLRCQHYFAACQVVARSELIMTMPKSYALELAEYLPLAIHETPFEAPSVPIRMYWDSRRSDDPAIEWLRNELLSLIQAH